MKITIGKKEDEKKEGNKRNHSIEIGKEGKSVRMSQSFSKTVYEWNKPKKMPKKDKVIWIENLEKKPVEAKVIKIVDTIKFVVVEVENSSKQWNMRHATDNWSDEKPKETLESSGSFNGFPEHSIQRRIGQQEMEMIKMYR